jgi:hypothetical protein
MKTKAKSQWTTSAFTFFVSRNLWENCERYTGSEKIHPIYQNTNKIGN